MSVIKWMQITNSVFIHSFRYAIDFFRLARANTSLLDKYRQRFLKIYFVWKTRLRTAFDKNLSTCRAATRQQKTLNLLSRNVAAMMLYSVQQQVSNLRWKHEIRVLHSVHRYTHTHTHTHGIVISVSNIKTNGEPNDDLT